MSERPAGLYLHVPFCARVCPYCDFAVRTGDAARRRRFVNHLIREIGLYEGYPLRFDTIYFGGGTPSLIDPRDVERILLAVAQRLDLADDRVVFLEANPDDVTAERAATWRELGVGVLSLGVQSFDARALDFLGRRHGPEQARGAIAAGRAAGFDTVSVDLIYGLPDQTVEAWRRQLEQAIDSGADHLSCYQLTVHPRTRFGLLRERGRLAELPLDDQAELFRVTHEYLGERGFAGYEVSQFARAPRHRSRHNRKYWDHTPYLGLGPSAHSFHDRRRWWNLRRTDPYQDEVAAGRRPVEAHEDLEPAALVLEALMTSLRTHAGADLGEIRRRWGIDLLPINRELVARLEARGVLAIEGERLVPTLDGLAVADGLARQFEIGTVPAS